MVDGSLERYFQALMRSEAQFFIFDLVGTGDGPEAETRILLILGIQFQHVSRVLPLPTTHLIRSLKIYRFGTVGGPEVLSHTSLI